MKIDDQMKAKLNLLKENDIKPNFAELTRQSGIDYRTIKRYYDGYEGKPATRNKPSKFDPYRDLIQKKLEIEHVTIRGVYEFLVDQNGEEVIGTYSNFAFFLEPSFAAAVIVVVPALIAVIFPEASTVATEGLFDVQIIDPLSFSSFR